MLKYIIKRIMLSVLILFGVSLIIYVLVRIQPGDNFIRSKYSMQLAQDNTGEIEKQVQAMEATYGLDVSPIVGYWRWLGNVLQGDWGNSFIFSVDSGKRELYYTYTDDTGQTQTVQYYDESEVPDGATTFEKPIATSSVIYIIYSKSGISFLISLVATIFEFIIAIPLGIISATKQYGVLDYTVTVIAMMGISLPTFFLGALLLKFFSIELGWFPYAGLTDPNSGLPTFIDNLWHLVLPLTTLIILSIGGLMRYTRTNMLEVLNADYIRTARAKGLSEHTVIYKHAFRNSLIPIVTMLAGILPSLFGGAMITETVFSIDGIGKAAYKAVTQGDIPFIMAYNMFLSALTVIGTLLSDLMYAVVDPRVKIGD
ncbi:MAG: ABC transporter permease [Eubacteriales bacterium]